MDAHYNAEEASECTQYYKRSINAEDEVETCIAKWVGLMEQIKTPDECIISAAVVEMDKVSVEQAEFPRAWKATLPSKYERKEAIFTVIGALQAKELPPVKAGSIRPFNIRAARQYATLVGFGNEKFETSLKNLQEVAYVVHLSFDHDSVESWAPEWKEDACGTLLTGACRYFTTGKDIPDEYRLSFPIKVDPAQVLTRLQTNDIAHCFDNDVSYLEIKNGRYVSKDPAGFRIGDIVQMGVAVAAFKVSKGTEDPKYVCKLVMKSLTFLDGEITKKAHLSRNKERALARSEVKKPGPIIKVSMKRRFEYVDSDSEEEGVPSARQRMEDLSLVDARAVGMEGVETVQR
ncbi:hypothetical protein B0H13DRAFT_1901957 [Mycena leptocephala]|nr:hypothetical protein B0H13DRAFT_1901957 [Mycena leptocephala]